MVSTQFKGFIGTSLLVTGAFVFGDAIHESVVVGSYAPTSAPAVLQGLLGLGLIAVGIKLYRPATEYVSTPSDADERGEQSPPDEGEAPELSPLSDEDLENLDADDGK